VESSIQPAAISRPLVRNAGMENGAGLSAVPATNLTDMATLSKPAQAFFTQARTQAGALRELADHIQQTANQDDQKEMLTDLYLRVHSLAIGAEACQQHSLSQISCALEGLLKKLRNQTGNLNTSTMKTVAGALSLIQDLCVDDPGLGRAINAPIRALAVDDDPIARRFMSNALQLNFLLPQSAEDGKTAVELTAKEPFDVIFLDVQMPDMDGFAVCQQIRKTTINRRTPVVFVTNHSDQAMKIRALECGGNDFISKPYICTELTLKTILFAFRYRLANPGIKTKTEIPSPVQAETAIAEVQTTT
jgi:CheY-like chemotaxis protein